MSSAILYLAIVAIWACVLIPRWLRRDSARGASAPAPAPLAAEPAPEADDGSFDAGSLEDLDEVAAPPARFAAPLSAEESHRRMLAARRRLLLMLIGLEIAAISLAFLGLAAVWVVVPPSIMLGGYLLLLREAGRADAEWAQHQAETAAFARARERARQAALARRDTPAEGISTEDTAGSATALAAKFAAAPVPADYEDHGRDFAPGLAGKYTTSNADANLAEPVEPAESADEDYYEDYDPPRLRAVGD
jgi:hypothetical protein